MSSTTRRISPSEWENWKSTILSLNSQNTLKQVMNIMTNTHGFTASKWQYEERLRAWKASKYISQDAWAIVFDAFDKIKAQDQESRILVDGKPDDARIRRARRTFDKTKASSRSRRNAKEVPTDFRRLSIGIKCADGTWGPYELRFSRPSVHSEASASRPLRRHINTIIDAGLHADSSPTRPPNMDMTDETPSVINALQISPLIAPAQPFPPQDLQQSGITSNELLSLDRMIWSEIDGFTPNWAKSPTPHNELSFMDMMIWPPADDIATNWAKSPPPLSSFVLLDVYHLMKDLPFSLFMKDLGTRLNLGGTTSLLKNPIQILLADVASPTPGTNQSTSNRHQLVVENLFSILQGMPPDETIQASGQNQQGVAMELGMVQSKLIHILLFSTANGFAGLQHVPLRGILKFLSRHEAINFQPQGKHSYIEQALAENLFRAAIEAKNKHFLQLLLASGSINVNDTICTINGKKYTPLERAVSLGDPATVQLLIDSGADVNKTFRADASEGGTVAMLLDWWQGAALERVQIGKVLLRAGAKLHLKTAKLALDALQSTELAFAIASTVPDIDHAAFIRGGFLTSVATHLKDWQASEIFTNMIKACEMTNCCRCLSEYRNELDRAYVQSAKHGHLQLLQQHQVLCRTPHRAFSAAIRSSRKEVINFIGTLNPDLNALPHTIDDEDDDWIREYPTTTSLAEAIRAGNEEVLLKLEDSGHLSHIHTGKSFEHAIHAAATMRNIEYVQKLLKHHPSPEPKSLGHAVLQAVESGDEDILCSLLKAGADVNKHLETSLQPSPLVVAIRQRNRYMVHAILNADVDIHTGNGAFILGDGDESKWCTVLGEAIKWADKSIIQAILSTFPMARLHGSEVVEVLEQGDMEFFEYLHDFGAITTLALTDCLEVGLNMCDAELTRTLVDMGADPRNPRILALCTERRPEMLHLFLELGSLGRSQVVLPGFGTDALIVAIRRGISGFESVRILLDSGFVDAKSFGGRYPHGPRTETPLGFAIKSSQGGDHSNFEVIRKLLEPGRCDPNSIVSWNEFLKVKHTALLGAIETRDKGLVELLIDHHANVNHEAQYGLKRTPLQKAVELESLELVTLLLEAGADVNGKPATRGGATALQLAAITGNCNIAATLLKQGADVLAPPAEVYGRWPLEGAAEHGRIDMIFFLWRASGGFGPDLCQSSMKLAEKNGYLACRDALAELAVSNSTDMPAITI